jgi:hypothetical protein
VAFGGIDNVERKCGYFIIRGVHLSLCQYRRRRRSDFFQFDVWTSEIIIQ